MFDLSSCVNDDQIIEPTQSNNQTDLISLVASTPPTIDGVVDEMWQSAKKLETVTQVPDPGNGLFAGYIGKQYPIAIRSMYDGSNIYFLAEWSDPTNSVQVQPWYFNPTTKRWTQEPSAKTFDANGALTRDGWGEDKLAMLWNIDKSTAKFASQTCYASCHVFTPYLNPVTNTMVPNQSANHYTNGANEKIDMWWLKIGRDPIHSQFSDEYQDWAGGPAYSSIAGGSANGRHQDDQVPSGSFNANYPYAPTYTANAANTGTSNNTQSLAITGSVPEVKVNVPKYIIPAKTNYYYILLSEVNDGTAKIVTAVDAEGVLTLSDGSTITPGADYQRAGDAITGGHGSKVVPSYISAPLTNGRADITCIAIYTGSGWVVEWKRALKTTGTLKQDVDFSALADEPFGVAIFDKSNYQHAIKPNLLLKFSK